MQLRMGFEGGGGFDVTEMGKEKRLAIWVVDDPDRIENVATLGVDPLTPEFDVDALARAPGRERVHPQDGADLAVAHRRRGQRLFR